jgi:hypothetical protein
LLLLFDFQGAVWKMPASIAERLWTLLEKPARLTIQVVETLPRDHTPREENWRKPEARPVHVHEGEQIVFAELRSLLRLVQTGELRVTDKSKRPTEDAVRLDSARILNHLESGGKVEDALMFLESHCVPPIPETVQTMLSDLARKGSVMRTVEEALLVEVADEPTAALIAHDSQAGKYCWLAGGRRLAVPRRNSRAFRSALKKLGFIIPDGHFPS